MARPEPNPAGLAPDAKPIMGLNDTHGPRDTTRQGEAYEIALSTHSVWFDDVPVEDAR